MNHEYECSSWSLVWREDKQPGFELGSLVLFLILIIINISLTPTIKINELHNYLKHDVKYKGN